MIACYILIGWIINAWISTGINTMNSTRRPRNFGDFMKLTFTPYILLNLKNIRKP